MGTGRPDRLTKATGERILVALRNGTSVKTAAEHAGVSARTVHRWVARGQGHGAAVRFRRFAVDVERARTSARVASFSSIRNALGEDWRAAAHYLRHVDPERDRDGADDVEVGASDLDLAKLSNAELSTLIRLTQKAHPGYRESDG